MRRNRIGRSALEVTQLGLGCAPLAGIYDSLAESAAVDTVEAAWEAGVRYFDTAPVYGAGLSEIRLGRALRGVRRDEYVLSSKVGYELVPLAPGEQTWDQFPGGLPFARRFDFSAEATRRSIEGSLERIGTDRLDIVWIHDPDGARGGFDGVDPYVASHYDEAMKGAYTVLDELRAAGVIGAIGVGLNQAPMLMDFARDGDFDAFLLAGRYTLLEQGPLDDLLPLCVERGISLVVGGPYNSGILATGPVPGARHNYAPATPEVLDRVRAIERVCLDGGTTLRAAALQFVLRHEAVAAVIPGVSSRAEMMDAASAVSDPIDDGVWAELRALGLVHPDSP